MKKLFKNLFLVLLVSLFAFAIVGCNNNNDDDEPEATKELENIDVLASTFDATYEYDEFKLEYLKLVITYTDGSSEEIAITEEMLSSKDLNKLKSAGNPKIQITYEYEGEAFSWTKIVHLVDSALRDKDLNKSGEYGAVVKAIRDNDKINFILEAGSNAAAISFSYTYDNAIMQLSNPVKGEAIGTPATITLEDGRISFAYTQLENITTEVILFTVTLTGNFRTSGLNVDENYSNALYTISDIDTFANEQILNVLYHASVK